MSYVKRTTRRLLGTTVGAAMLLGLPGCGYAKNIQEFPEPWQTLEPGKPRAKFPTVRVIEPGQGPAIELGDIVQLSIRTKFGKPEPTWRDRGDWWIWIGFRTNQETSFFAAEPRTASALVGLRQGTSLEFVASEEGSGLDPEIAGTLSHNVFGNSAQYSSLKNTQGSENIYVATYHTPSIVDIKRVCKGQAQYRTVRLLDDSPVQVCSWAPISCHMSEEPREGWIDEAKIEAVCSDGQTATFQYGPMGSRNGKAWRGPVNPANHFQPWIHDAWNKLPAGVQLK